MVRISDGAKWSELVTRSELMTRTSPMAFRASTRWFAIGCSIWVFCFASIVLAQEAKLSALIAAARSQVGVTLYYDPAYVKLAYPMGDVAIERGVCTDVVIRAFRTGLNFDLQQALNEDMRKHFAKYPKNWGLKQPDANIDHRRVPNLQTYFTRFGKKLTTSTEASAYQPGDIVTWIVNGHLPHIGIVSDRTTWITARPLILHNIGQGTQEEDKLFAYPITGHYRFIPRAANVR